MNVGELRCDDLEALAPEVALGTLSGPEHAGAVAHLASCAACQRRVAELARVVDAMLLVAPEDDPSERLEAGVLAQTVGQAAHGGSTKVAPRWRRPLLAIAAVAAIAVGVTVAVLVGDDDGGDRVRTALAVSDGGASVCRAVINEVDPAWLFVSLDEGETDQSSYDVELHLEDAGPLRVGRLEVRDGHGELAVTVNLDGRRARAVRLIDAANEAEYEATFG